MILVVDMNWKKDSLAFNEFVLSIVSVIEPFGKCEVKHFTELGTEKLDGYERIILSGTTLKDNATLEQVEKFNWLKTVSVPVLGICAGMQTIGKVFGGSLARCLQIGLTEINTVKENSLFKGKFRAYTLHNYSFVHLDGFEVLAESATCIQAIKHNRKNIFGVLFHPEVRNQEILKSFIKIP